MDDDGCKRTSISFVHLREHICYYYCFFLLSVFILRPISWEKKHGQNLRSIQITKTVL